MPRAMPVINIIEDLPSPVSVDFTSPLTPVSPRQPVRSRPKSTINASMKYGKMFGYN
jgi:hypothetical protein